MGTHNKCLSEAVLIRTHNICICGELRKVFICVLLLFGAMIFFVGKTSILSRAMLSDMPLCAFCFIFTYLYFLMKTSPLDGIKLHSVTYCKEKYEFTYYELHLNKPCIWAVSNCTCFVCVEVLQPSQPNGVMSSAVSLPNHTLTGKA